MPGNRHSYRDRQRRRGKNQKSIQKTECIIHTPHSEGERWRGTGVGNRFRWHTSHWRGQRGESSVETQRGNTHIDQESTGVATAQVAEQDGYFTGLIDLSLMSATFQRQFEEYDEIINNHMFSLLNEIEEKIGTILLQVVFEDDHEADLTDVQIYPSTVSFKVVKEAARRTGKA